MIPAILSGGSGTRLWPVSRESHPKQFCDLFDESLILKTVRRLQPMGSPWVITTSGMRVVTERLYRDLNIPTSQILFEPMGRNTAAAIALLCRQLELTNRTGEVVGIFPADQFIENTKLFGEALELAQAKAREGHIVTLGITPTFPATGYGYIELDAAAPKGKLAAMTAKGFREKPDAKTAEGYISTGRYVWNAGIFVFQASKMIELLKQHQAEIWNGLAALKADHSNLKEIYPALKSVSIDYGIMEKLPSHVCVPCENLGWSDVGSWDEVARISQNPKDQVVEVKAKGNFVYTRNPSKQYAIVGADDLMVVDTADALLVCKKGDSQSVKDAQAALLAAKKPAATQHEFEFRPWGYFEILRDTERFKSKVIRVDPGQQLSYQSHAKRAEHWVVIRGNPEVVLNDEVHRPKPGEHIYIPLGAKHRMRNTTKETVEFVEVQVGSYFGEDDIVRYQDDYKRS